MSKRKNLDVRVNDIDYIDFYDVLDGKSPDGVVETMKDWQERFAGRDVYFHVKRYEYDGDMAVELRERREETDKEYNKRIAEEKKVKDKAKESKKLKEAKELAEYERLKKKFDNI